MKDISREMPAKSLVIASTLALIGLGIILSGNGQAQADRHIPTKSNANQASILDGRPLRADPEAARRFTELQRPVLAAMDLAYKLYFDGDLDGCLKAAERASHLAKTLGVSSRLEAAQRLKGRVLIRQGKPRKALEALQKGWKSVENAKGVDLDVALCYIRLGDTKRAAQFYSQQDMLARSSSVSAADLPPANTRKGLEARILLARGGLFSSTGLFEDAARDYDAAALLTPRNALIHYRLAAALPLARRSERPVHFAYALKHGSPKIQRKAQYGLAEFDRETQAKAIAKAKLMP
jgi:tetratricopeptide (TPR) repeat protein